MRTKEIFLKTMIITIAIFIFPYCGKDSSEPDIDDDDTEETQGTFTDSRDGKTYNWIKIGDQTWMAENLAYKPSSKAGNYWRYKDDEANVSKYGYLYDMTAAQTACPSGWRLPTKSECEALINYLGGGETALNKLRAAGSDYWCTDNPNVTNSSGFSARGSGYKSTSNFYFLTENCKLWTSTFYQDTQYSPYYYYFNIVDDIDGNRTVQIWYDYSEYGMSIRCIKE